MKSAKKISKSKKPKKRGPKNKGGRPTKYKAAYCGQAYKLCLMGATNEELADFFEVNASSIKEWMNVYPKFSTAIKRGREDADANVGKKLYERALGYSHKEDKIFNDNGRPLIVPTIKHYPPDPTAAIFWLKNRQPKKWRDKQDIEHSGSIETKSVGPIPIMIVTPEQQNKLNEHVKTDGNPDA